MRIIVTAGPTRERIDAVRFITNASSGKMGCAVAATAARAGHEVTLLAGESVSAAGLPESCAVDRFVSAEDLRNLLEKQFGDCGALVMAAAVGDFRLEKPFTGKVPRGGGPITVRLVPTEDILAGLGGRKRPGQVIVAFAVEDGPAGEIEAKARSEMAVKNADYVVLNTPSAMGADRSRACVLDPAGIVLPWADRTKESLGEEIVRLLGRTGADHRTGRPGRRA